MLDYISDRKRAWIRMLTCAVYCTLSLDLTTLQSTAFFIDIFRYFIAKRRLPGIIYSGNWSNLFGLDNLYKIFYIEI